MSRFLYQFNGAAGNRAKSTPRRPRRRRSGTFRGALLAGLCVVAATQDNHARELHLRADRSFKAAVERLEPGDTLIVHPGVYADSGRISIRVRGTHLRPVVITAAAGGSRPLITRNAHDSRQNTINIEGASHLTLRGLAISGNGGDGVRLNDGAAHIALEGLEISDIAVGINFKGNLHDITARGNHIHDTMRTGEGMYVGCNRARCITRDSLIEGNWIHDTLKSEQGDGIEIKSGSHSIVVRDNVIHDTRFPCILVYGTSGRPRNLIEANAMWNCGDAGIQAAADAEIRNNVVLAGPATGFTSHPHQGVTPGNLAFVHNTVVGIGACLNLRGWNDRAGLVFANNAIYCARADSTVGGLRGVVASGNVLSPAIPPFPPASYSPGASPGRDMVDPDGLQAYPSSGSTLRRAGDPAFMTAVDFNGVAREDPPDAGAYAFAGPVNPGWRVRPGFKDAGEAARRASGDGRVRRDLPAQVGVDQAFLE
jgi:hypothetical protein